MTSQALCRESRDPRIPRNSAGVARPRARELRARPGQVRIESRPGVGADRHDALLAALAEQPHDLGRAVAEQVVDVEADHLRHPRARRVQQLEQRPVAQIRRLVAVGRGEQLLDLVDGQRLRQPRGLLRGDEVARRVGLEHTLAARKR